MSDEKPSPVTFHEYNIPSLNTLFAWSAAILLITSLWMIWADYSREWKEYQRRFNDLEIARTEQAIPASEKAIDQKKLTALTARLTEQEASASAREDERARLQTELDSILGTWYNADQRYRFIKAELDVARYRFDEELKHDPDSPTAQAEFDHMLADVEERRLAFESVNAQKVSLESGLLAIAAEAKATRKQIVQLTEDKTRLEKKLEKIGKSGLIGFANQYFRDRPLVDFMAPSIKVKQVILPDLHEDVNFLTVPRVDRCMTCHLAITEPGFTDPSLPPEFRTHPRLDELLGRNHPVERFGCTGCHEGGGRAITFIDAAHTPRNPEQEKEWKEKYDWHPLHHWDFPMLPLNQTEAHCANCHADETRVPGADKLNAGRKLVEQYGCFGCHKIDRPGYDELRKVGPDLAHISAKVSKDWMYKWIQAPKSFRPSTRMPRIWGNTNTSVATATMDYPLRDKVEIEAVTRHLMSRSQAYEALPPLPAAQGDVANGKWVVQNRGCLACHIVGKEDTGAGRFGATHGPELSQVGSKLSIEWLYAWIRDPKALWPGTLMPNLRLTDQEALDAATYLLTLKNPEFEAMAVPDLTTSAASKMLEDITYEYLRKQTTTADAKAQMEKMDPDARYAFLGEKLIGRYGCFGCHDNLPGFENAQRIGTELTTWSSKLLTQLDFGLLHDRMPHNKIAWLHQKLENPRAFDEGKVDSKHPQDLLKMPHFEFTQEEIDHLLTAAFSYRRDLVQQTGHRALDADAAVIERGRRLVEQVNCRGCHVIEDIGGGMETVLEGGKPYAPPVLVANFKLPDGRKGRTEQGAKVKPDWFFRFLKEPTPIRPWFHARMPSFGFDDQQATDVVKYFSTLAKSPFPYDSFQASDLPAELVGEGSKQFVAYKCISCHLPLDQARADAEQRGVPFEEVIKDLAPNLELAKDRLQYGWLEQWLKDPGFIQKDTRMPQNFYLWDEDQSAYVESFEGAGAEMTAIRAYLQYHGQRLPERLAAAP